MFRSFTALSGCSRVLYYGQFVAGLYLPCSNTNLRLNGISPDGSETTHNSRSNTSMLLIACITLLLTLHEQQDDAAESYLYYSVSAQ